MLKFLFYFIGLLILGVGFYQIWNLMNQVNTPSTPSTPQAAVISQDWKTITHKTLTLKIPPDWNSYSDESVSQFPTPLNLSNAAVYNLVRYKKEIKLLIRGSYNDDLFNKLYSLKDNERYTGDFQGPDEVTFIKLGEGQIDSGQRFVIVRSENKNNPFTSKDVKGFIFLGNNQLLIFTLSHYDEFGLNTFKEILKSVKLP